MREGIILEYTECTNRHFVLGEIKQVLDLFKTTFINTFYHQSESTTNGLAT